MATKTRTARRTAATTVSAPLSTSTALVPVDNSKAALRAVATAALSEPLTNYSSIQKANARRRADKDRAKLDAAKAKNAKADTKASAKAARAEARTKAQDDRAFQTDLYRSFVKLRDASQQLANILKGGWTKDRRDLYVTARIAAMNLSHLPMKEALAKAAHILTLKKPDAQSNARRTVDEHKWVRAAEQNLSATLTKLGIETGETRGGANNANGRAGNKDKGAGRPKGSTGGKANQNGTHTPSDPDKSNPRPTARAFVTVECGDDNRPIAPSLSSYDDMRTFMAFHVAGLEATVAKNARLKGAFIPVWQRFAQAVRRSYEVACADIKAELDAEAAKAEKAEAKPATTRAKRTAAAKNADTVAKATKGRRRTTK